MAELFPTLKRGWLRPQQIIRTYWISLQRPCMHSKTTGKQAAELRLTLLPCEKKKRSRERRGPAYPWQEKGHPNFSRDCSERRKKNGREKSTFCTLLHFALFPVLSIVYHSLSAYAPNICGHYALKDRSKGHVFFTYSALLRPPDSQNQMLSLV